MFNVSCFQSKLIEKATETINKIFDYKEITCVVWWRTDPENVIGLLENYKGSVVTFALVEPTTYDFHRLVKYKQTVLFASDPDEFKYFIHAVVNNVVNPISVILIFTEIVTNNILTELMKLAWQNDIGNFIVISVCGNNNVTLTTYIPYRDKECGNYSPIILPENKYFIRKFNNFQKCPIRVTAVNAVIYFVLKADNGTVHVSGIDGNVLNLVLERVNATMKFIGGNNNRDIEVVLNGSAAGLFGDIINGSADILGPSLLLTKKRYTQAQPLYVYQTLNLVWCLPRRREIYMRIKVLLPFLTSITIFFIFAWISLFILIMLIHKFSSVNPNLKYVTFRILSMSLGQPIKFVTENWLANSIFVLWIWFCLVIRVAYQSDLVERFELTVLEPRVSTAREALELVDGHGGFASVKDYFNNTPMEMNYKTIRLNETSKYINMIANGKRFLLVTNEILIKYFNPEVQILDERVTSVPTSFYVRPRWPAVYELNKLIERIAETGFVSKILSDYIHDNRVKRNFSQTKTPKPLDMSILLACFNGLLVMYIVCVIIFAIEIYYYKYNTEGLFDFTQ
ncbi:PREDICTED: uncharacterized protein LOC106118768 [Papilio xuthus]|uniref:Uncharacterized protein LOC106118768 n=1 Tax=Papilio xuthus TaxID=66420 RepID=A0AAJ7EA52_PAPXU|nr:PREDICTED: uncharacterized protein LOC106118768 [Papilio xuthus]